MVYRILSLPAVAALALSCSQVEKSEYKPPTAAQSKDGSSNEVTEATDFGVTSCVADYLKKEGDIFQPGDVNSTLANFDSKSSLSTAEFTDLWDLLAREVVEAGSGYVDYSALEGDQQVYWNTLTSSLAGLEVPVDENDQTAFWTNVYNVVMINHIISKSLEDVSSSFELFKEEVEISGHNLSLDQIEKGILRLGGGKEEHPGELTVAKMEPRLHFALVCAAKSCPKLRNFAYRGNSIDKALEQNQLMFFNSTIHVSSDDGVKVSQLFGWFAEDFKELAGEDSSAARKELAQNWIKSECRDDSEAIAAEFESKDYSELSTLTYDWTVNSQE